jgi:hypothetical protein
VQQECVRPLEFVPSRVRVYTPIGVEALVPIVRVLSPIVGSGLNAGLEFGGGPVTASVIGLGAFPGGFDTPMEYVAVDPAATICCVNPPPTGVRKTGA